MKLLQILIADDHPIFRRGLKEILVDEVPDAVYTEVDTGEQALTLVRKQTWDALLLDLNLPGRSGLEILKDVKLARPDMPVLILSAASEEQYGARVLKAGASGFITKLRAPHEIAAAVAEVLRGGVYVSPAMGIRLARELSGTAPHGAPQLLSEREMEVLRRIGAGKGTKEIATELSLSQSTISTYRARIMEKLGVRTTTAMIRFAIEKKMIEQD
jgi:two-component system invasion response regulator UvrY